MAYTEDLSIEIESDLWLDLEVSVTEDESDTNYTGELTIHKLELNSPSNLVEFGIWVKDITQQKKDWYQEIQKLATIQHEKDKENEKDNYDED